MQWMARIWRTKTFWLALVAIFTALANSPLVAGGALTWQEVSVACFAAVWALFKRDTDAKREGV